MPRNLETYLKFISGLSESVTRSFRSAHKSFAGIEELIESDPGEERLYDALQEWINGASLHPSTVKTYFSSIRGYFYYRGIKLDDYDIRQNLRFPRVSEEKKHSLSRGELGLILEAADRRRRIMYLAQSSSGMRIGELLRLRRKDLDTRAERITVRIPAAFTKTRRGRTTFFSSEVSVPLLPRLEGMPGSDLVFGASEDPVRATLTEVMYLGRLVGRLGLGERYESSRNRKITSHSFRAYFITRASRHDQNLAALLAGHEGYLLQYDRPTEKEMLKEYLKIEPDLLVGDRARHDEEVSKLRQDLELHVRMENINKALIEKMQRRLATIEGQRSKATRGNVGSDKAPRIERDSIWQTRTAFAGSGPLANGEASVVH